MKLESCYLPRMSFWKVLVNRVNFFGNTWIQGKSLGFLSFPSICSLPKSLDWALIFLWWCTDC